LSEFSDELESLVESSAPSVVAVEHGHGQGSGIIVSGDGYVITNAHVVHGRAGVLSVRLAGGEELPADVVGEDHASDLAVLRVGARGLSSLSLDESRRLRVGQLVLAIGNPLRFERSVSLGVVSAIDRSLPGPGRRPFEGLVQTDAAINPGNSGGPLLDARGAVVGINTAVIPRAHGLGFAIPAHTAAWVTAVLIRDGRVERPLLGISAQGMTSPPKWPPKSVRRAPCACRGWQALHPPAARRSSPRICYSRPTTARCTAWMTCNASWCSPAAAR